MKRTKEIFASLERFRQVGDPTVLATVVATRGSTYRKPGTHMILTGSGTIVGAVSGGCLEGDLLEIVRAETRPEWKARLVLYDAGAPEELIWGLATGCNGVVEVLLTPEPSFPEAVMQALAGAMARRDRCALVTVLAGGRAGERCLVDSAGILTGKLGGLGSLVVADALELMRAGVQASLIYPASPGAAPVPPDAAPALPGAAPAPSGAAPVPSDAAPRGESALHGRPSPPGDEPQEGEMRLFIETILPPPALCLFGAGHDALPLADLAGRTGWAVTVVDHRETFLTGERFPIAERLVRARPEDGVRAAGVGPEDHCILMTHNYHSDKALLRELAAAGARSVGVLGPKERTEQMLREIEEEGGALPDGFRDRLAAPLGLDIGGQAPEEVALSAIAELQAIRYGRNAGRLRDRRGPIHQPLELQLPRRTEG